MADPTSSLPTINRRFVNAVAVKYSTAASGATSTRDVHTFANMTDAATNFSRAEILSLSCNVIPSVDSVGYACLVYVAWTHGEKTISNLEEMMALPHCQTFNFGSNCSLAPVQSYACDFSRCFAQPFIKPAPVEGFRPRLAVLAFIAKIDSGTSRALSKEEKDAKIPIFSINIQAELALHGNS